MRAVPYTAPGHYRIKPNIACGTCSCCQAGRTTQWRNPIGLGTLRDGVFVDPR